MGSGEARSSRPSQHHPVAGVVATLVAHDPLDAATEQIGRLSFALVPPLGTDEHDCRHGIVSRFICLKTVAAGDPPYPSRLRGASLTTGDVVVLPFGGR